MDQRNFTNHKQIIVFSGKIKRPINIVGKGESEALGLVLSFIFDKSGTQLFPYKRIINADRGPAVHISHQHANHSYFTITPRRQSGGRCHKFSWIQRRGWQLGISFCPGASFLRITDTWNQGIDELS